MIISKIAGILIILVGLKVTFLKSWTGNWTNYDFSNNYLYLIVGSLCIYVGILCFKVRKPKKTIEHTICPNCKQTYNYKDLKDGKCPTCKETNTIDIEQYYKDNPFKDEDEN